MVSDSLEDAFCRWLTKIREVASQDGHIETCSTDQERILATLEDDLGEDVAPTVYNGQSDTQAALLSRAVKATDDHHWNKRLVFGRNNAGTGYADHIFARAYCHHAKEALDFLGDDPSRADTETLLESTFSQDATDSEGNPIQRMVWKYGDVLDVDELSQASDVDLRSRGTPAVSALRAELHHLRNVRNRLDHNARCSNILRWYNTIISRPASDPSFPSAFDEERLHDYLSNVTFAPKDMEESIRVERALLRYMRNEADWDREEREEQDGKRASEGIVGATFWRVLQGLAE